MAPEFFTLDEDEEICQYGYSVDYYAFGILVFELICGYLILFYINVRLILMAKFESLNFFYEE